MKMYALSIKQPWLDLILDGKKTLEIRTWRTHYRGPLLLVSSKFIDRTARLSIYPDVRKAALSDGHVLGHALGVCKLVNCRPMKTCDKKAALCDFYPGFIAWVLSDIKEIEPFPVKGQLGLYEMEVPDGMGR
jgi:hypothetical protein